MFGRDKIDIRLERTNYAPGDTVSGNVTLTLKRPVRARELTISLIGEYKVTGTPGHTEPGSNSPYVPQIVHGTSRWTKAGIPPGPSPSQAIVRGKVRICDFKQQLDGEGEYGRGRQYHFDIKIRTAIPTSPKWYLLAELDIPGGLDISKKVKLTIR